MSDAEQFGGTRTADALYSKWHRVESLERFLTHQQAWKLAMIDLDHEAIYRGTVDGPWVEYCRHTSEPLWLTETALDVGQAHKTTLITERLARRAGIHAICVLITPDADVADVDQFRVRRIYTPGDANIYDPEAGWTPLTPAKFARALCALRDEALGLLCQDAA